MIKSFVSKKFAANPSGKRYCRNATDGVANPVRHGGIRALSVFWTLLPSLNNLFFIGIRHFHRSADVGIRCLFKCTDYFFRMLIPRFCSGTFKAPLQDAINLRSFCPVLRARLKQVYSWSADFFYVFICFIADFILTILSSPCIKIINWFNYFYHG